MNNAMIEKKIIYAGSKPATFKDGTKVFFHFQTRTCNKDKTLIDDSKKLGAGKPLEIVLGKKFKLEVWEVILQKMAIGEVAEFVVNQKLVSEYPLVSKTIREAHLPAHSRKTHHCAMMLQQKGIGYNDLNELMKNPCDLEFTIELIKVEQPEEYQKEVWQMNDVEQLKHVEELRLQGNNIFKENKFHEASDLYGQAISVLERLLIKEKPQSPEWLELNKLKNPLLLNYSQCKLSEGDFYAVIEHCTSVLKTDPDNVKALFRRAKGHVGAWNPSEAKEDFERVINLDGSLAPVVKKELDALEKLIKLKNRDDKEKLKGLFNS